MAGCTVTTLTTWCVYNPSVRYPVVCGTRVCLDVEPTIFLVHSFWHNACMYSTLQLIYKACAVVVSYRYCMPWASLHSHMCLKPFTNPKAVAAQPTQDLCQPKKFD